MKDGAEAASLALSAALRPEIQTLETSGIAQVFALGIGREGVIPLWVGEGDRPTPDFICEAAIASLRAGETFYSHKRGLPELRQAITDYTNRLYGTAVDAEQVTVTGSGMSAMVLALQAIVGPGDNVIVVNPVWPNFMSAVQVAGGELRPVRLDTRPDGGFRLDLDKLLAAVDEGTRAIYVASPGNPTGWIMERDQQEPVLELCRARRIWMIADEVYARFAYGRPHAPSFLELARPDDPLFVINSFSKAWAMTGWRLGWITHPAPLWPTFDRLIEFFNSGSPAFLQRGALTALRDGEAFVEDMVARCRRGGDLVYQRLSAMPGLRMAPPPGAFYAFFEVDGLTDSLAYAKEILERSNVGLAPGSAFGPGGEGHLRLCFANSTEKLSEALDRLEPIFAERAARA